MTLPDICKELITRERLYPATYGQDFLNNLGRSLLCWSVVSVSVCKRTNLFIRFYSVSLCIKFIYIYLIIFALIISLSSVDLHETRPMAWTSVHLCSIQIINNKQILDRTLTYLKCRFFCFFFFLRLLHFEKVLRHPNRRATVATQKTWVWIQRTGVTVSLSVKPQRTQF